MSQVKAVQRQKVVCSECWFSYNAPNNNFLFPEDSKLTWLDSHSKFNNIQRYEDWEVGNSVSVLTLSHSGQSIHALHDKWGGKGEEKNWIFWSLKSVKSVLPEQIAVCCFPVGVLGISHLSLLLPFSHYCYLALSISLSAWQRDSNTGIFLTMSAVAHLFGEDIWSSITDKTLQPPACPLDTARAGNGSISAGDMLIKLATYYQNETLREAAALFVRSNRMHFSQPREQGAWKISRASCFVVSSHPQALHE